MNDKYYSHRFAAMRKQIIAIEQQESMLALYAGKQFVDCFRSIAKTLSQNTTRSYIDYLIEAQEMISQGKSEKDTYEYFVSKLQRLQEGES